METVIDNSKLRQRKTSIRIIKYTPQCKRTLTQFIVTVGDSKYESYFLNLINVTVIINDAVTRNLNELLYG